MNTPVYMYKVDPETNTITIRKQHVLQENSMFLMISPDDRALVHVRRDELNKAKWPQGFATTRESANRLVRQALNHQVEVFEDIVRKDQAILDNLKKLVKNL